MAQEKQTQGKTTAEGKHVAIRKGSESRALSPFQEMEDMMERMEHMFEEFFPDYPGFRGAVNTPF